MDYRLRSDSGDTAHRTSWYIGLRWLFLSVIIFPGVVTLYVLVGWNQEVRTDAFLGLLAFLTNGVFYLAARKFTSNTASKRLAAVILVADVFLVSLLIMFKGGIESRSPILYTIPILISGAILGRRAMYKVAFAAIAAYDAISIGDYLGIVRPLDIMVASLHKDGIYILNSIIFFSSILIVISMAADFLTRLLMEKERQANEHLENLNRAQSIAKFGSWNWNLETNEIEWSKVMYDLFGISPEKAIITPRMFYEKIHPDDQKLMFNTIQKSREKRNGFSLDFRVVPGEGEVRYLHSDGQVVQENSGRAERMIGTARDITEERLLDQAKNEFVALASHQLRTPTTVVKQYLLMLLDGYAGELSEKQKNFVKTAYKSNELQITTINDLLNIAQIDSGKMKLHREPFDLVALLRAVIEEQTPRLEEKLQLLSLKTRFKRLDVVADKHRLRMAIENIIENAHKYSPDKKPVTIHLTATPKQVRIAVKDRGIGIDKKDLPKVFRKFTRIENPASRLQEGTGLGLYWVERVVKLHGGSILVSSKPRQGTTFTIVLPRRSRKSS